MFFIVPGNSACAVEIIFTVTYLIVFLTMLFLFRMAEDENSSDTCKKTEITASTLDTEEVIKNAPRISTAVDIIPADAPQEDSESVEAAASEEKQLFCPPELGVEEEDFVVDMAEDCFIGEGDAQPSLGKSRTCLSKIKVRNFVFWIWIIWIWVN